MGGAQHVDDPPGGGGKVVLADRYELVRRIGVGVTSLVYLAHDHHTQREVAVKVLRHPTQRTPETYRRFVREGRLLRTLQHPNIVRFLDFGPTAESVFIVTEYLPGQDLSDLLDRQKVLDLPLAMSVLMQLCLALEAAHAKKVLHRDLKPANLRLVRYSDGALRVKVLDFGLAKPLTDANADMVQTEVGQVLGTPNYMAPEVIRAQDVDRRADIYSTAALAYRLVTGHPVFESKVPTEVLLGHLKKTPVPPSLCAPGRNIPPALDRLVIKALSKKPSGRPRKAKALYRGFRSIAKNLA